MRLATFNLENLDDDTDRGTVLAERIPLLRPQLERLHADVLCLQEVNAQRMEPKKHAARRFAALDRLLAGTEYATFHRAATHKREGEGPLDVHNLVVLSRYPIRHERQYWHDLVPPPQYTSIASAAPEASPARIAWERPVLHVQLELPGGMPVDVLNLHLRSPLAANIEGQKQGPFTWKSTSGWAEGFFLATVKRAGQALETRLAVDAIFDRDPQAAIVVCGDMNAEEHEMPVRILRAEEEDTGNGALAGRILFPLERSVSESQRYSVRHAGRSLMLDHILASRAMVARLRMVEIHNESLGDEVIGYALAQGSPEAYHAPLIAEFDFPPK